MFPTFLSGSSDEVAPKLLGCILVREIGGRTIRAKIVETESYDQTDAASHSFRGKTPRTEIMFGPSGFLYVYFTYGMHYCCNIVSGEDGEGSAVLIRAVEPLNNIDYIETRRGKSGVEITNGPAKVCYALGIDRNHNGHDLRTGDLRLEVGEPIDVEQIAVTKRIGISKNKDDLKRFYIHGNSYVSKSSHS